MGLQNGLIEMLKYLSPSMLQHSSSPDDVKTLLCERSDCVRADSKQTAIQHKKCCKKIKNCFEGKNTTKATDVRLGLGW